MMRLPRLCLLVMLCAVAPLRAQPAAILTGWDHITVAPMKTSIYVGSVTLTTGVFERRGSTLTTSYQASVRPWFFWGESGTITITLSDAELAKMARGERAEFSGTGANQKKKPRTVTGYAQPADASSGKMKVRVMADGIELIFNGTYHFGAAPK